MKDLPTFSFYIILQRFFTERFYVLVRKLIVQHKFDSTHRATLLVCHSKRCIAW